jgi:hypothetical protein
MKTREISRSLTSGVPDTNRRAFSRRSVLAFAGALGAVAPFGVLGAARALTASGGGSLPYLPGDPLICRAVANSEELQGPPRQLKLAWNANAACTVAAAVARNAASLPSTTSMSNSSISAVRPTSCWRRLRLARRMPVWGWRCAGSSRWNKGSMFALPPVCTAAASGSSAPRLRISTMSNRCAARQSGSAIRRARRRTSSRSSLPKRASIRPRT